MLFFSDQYVGVFVFNVLLLFQYYDNRISAASYVTLSARICEKYYHL